MLAAAAIFAAAEVRQRLPGAAVRVRRDLLHRPARAERAHRVHGPDLARPRRLHGDRRLHDRDPRLRRGPEARRPHVLGGREGRLDDPAGRARRRPDRLRLRLSRAAADGPLPRARDVRDRGGDVRADQVRALRAVHGRRRRDQPVRVRRAHAPGRDDRSDHLRDDLGADQVPRVRDRELQRVALLPVLGGRADHARRCLAAAARQDRPFVPRRPRQRAGRGLLRGQPRHLQDARVRDQRLLRGRRRRAARDRDHLRQPGHVPDHALDLPARRRRRRRPRLALAARLRRDLHPVPAALGAGGLEGAGGAGGGLRGDPDPPDDPAPGRRGRPDPACSGAELAATIAVAEPFCDPNGCTDDASTETSPSSARARGRDRNRCHRGDEGRPRDQHEHDPRRRHDAVVRQTHPRTQPSRAGPTPTSST